MQKEKKKKLKIRAKKKDLTGEDISLLEENRNKNRHRNVCDNHWDGC